MPEEKHTQRRVLMLLSNAFDPDPRVHREAKALVDAGFQVTILGWDRDRKTSPAETIDGIQVERIFVDSTHGRGSSQMFFLMLFWVKAFFACLTKSFDVVHAHDFDTLPLGYLLAKARRRKLVYDSHESYVDMLHALSASLRSAIMRVENFIMKRADLVITVGEILREYLESRGARNVCVVGNWQDPEKFVFDEPSLGLERTRLGVKAGQKVICFIANMGAERRIPELIEAAGQAPGAFLVLGGKGPCAEIARIASERHDNIAYLGYVHPSRVPFYTALADIVFYGFDPDNPNARFSAPNKLFECLAAGKVMVTGNFGEIGKIVRESGCGAILEDYSVGTILQALDDLTAERVAECSRQAARICKSRYSWDVAERCLVGNYQQVCSLGS